MSNADAFATVEGELESSPDTLKALAQAVEQMVEAQADLDQLTEDAEALRKSISRIAELTIPELMDTANIKKITVAGQDLTMKEDFYGGLPKAEEKRAAALAWLHAHDGGGLVKTEVIATFGQSESDAAHDLITTLVGDGLAAKLIENVNPMTLKKYARDRMADGDILEPEKLGLHYVRIAKLKPAKGG